MYKKRTSLDFSNHIIETEFTDNCKMWYIRKPGTFIDSVRFINAYGVLSVTGDYGNWIFGREFWPSADNYVSDSYWCEKLSIASCQEHKKHDPDIVLEEIKYKLATLRESWSDKRDRNELREYYRNCLFHREDEFDYISAAREIPTFADYEDVICEGKKVDYWLLVIFDAFEEICKRMKKRLHE